MALEIAKEVLPDEESLANRAAEIFLEISPKVVVLSGGSTPRRTYEVLSEKDFDWPSADVFITDERWGPQDHDDSNWRMVSRALVDRVGARGHPVDLTTTPESAATAYEKELSEHLPIDFGFFGLGPDGHTASLFPEDPALDVEDSLVVSTESSFAGYRRVTLTLPAHRQVAHGVFLVSGSQKRDALRLLLEGADIPAARIRPSETLTILADSAAAS